MRKLLIALAAACALTLLGLWHWYLALRLAIEPGWSETTQFMGTALIFGLGALVALHPLAERRFSHGLARAFAWPTSIWMGIGFWLTLGLWGTDVLSWLAGTVAAAGEPDVEVATTFARKRAWLLLLLVAGAAVPALRSGLSPPKLERVAIRLPRWPQKWAGFRIAQISDIHIGSILDERFAREITRRVNALDADLIAVTGDLVDGPVDKLRDQVAPFAELRARHGVYFVTGNHDHYSGDTAWVERVRELGWRVLRNERVEIAPSEEHCDDVFELAGVDDYRSRKMPGEGGADFDRALADCPEDRFVLMLSHDPASFRSAAKRGVDLQLSGHTHGGQIWPFHYFVKLAVPFVAGLHRLGGSILYVSRGTGFWGPPMRLFAPAEITELALLPEFDSGDAKAADHPTDGGRREATH